MFLPLNRLPWVLPYRQVHIFFRVGAASVPSPARERGDAGGELGTLERKRSVKVMQHLHGIGVLKLVSENVFEHLIGDNFEARCDRRELWHRKIA